VVVNTTVRGGLKALMESEMANLGKVTNTNASGGPGGGIGSNCLSGPAVFVDERPTEWLNAKETNARRGVARDSGDGQGKRNPNEVSGR
jgi:hypothetical protein